MEGQPLCNRFIEKGLEGRNHFGLYLAGVVIVLVGYIVGQFPLLFLFFRAVSNGYVHQTDPDLSRKILDPAAMHVSANTLLILELSMFIAAMLALWLVITKLHKKKFLSVITSASRMRWKRVLLSFSLVLGLLCIFLFRAVSSDKSIEFRFSAGPFFGTVAIALLLLPVQTWWEEFFFRGYLLQGIGNATRSAWLPLIITSVIFGCMHLANNEVDAYGVLAALPMYILPGFFLGFMAVMDEGLELAMGYHLANNIFGTVFITSPDSSIQANALYMTKTSDASGEILSTLLINFIIISAFWMIYRWDYRKLFGRYAQKTV